MAHTWLYLCIQLVVWRVAFSLVCGECGDLCIELACGEWRQLVVLVLVCVRLESGAVRVASGTCGCTCNCTCVRLASGADLVVLWQEGPTLLYLETCPT